MESEKPVLDDVRVFEGAVADEEIPGLAGRAGKSSIAIPPTGGLDATVVVEWHGGSGVHLLGFEFASEPTRSIPIDVSQGHVLLLRVRTQFASEVTADRPKTYPLRVSWDGELVAQRFLTIRRRRL